MASVVKLIREIRPRPALYFGRHEIESCHAFIAGWLHGQEHVEDADVLAGFQDWIQKRFRVTGTQGWHSIILFYSQDSAHALDAFFKLFDTYQSERDKADAS